MTTPDKQIYTPPTGTLTSGHIPQPEWVIQFTGNNWEDVVSFLDFFQIHWCMHRCGSNIAYPDHLEIQDENGIFHKVRISDWITVDDSTDRYLGVFADRYFQTHYEFGQSSVSRIDA